MKNRKSVEKILLVLLSILGGMGFASIVETSSFLFWGLYAAIGTALMLWITNELVIYIYI